MIEKKRNKNYKQRAFKEDTSPKKTITWIYNPARSGDFWFVDVEGEDKGYYVFSFNKKDALAWDKVLAEVKSFRWKDEAKVIKVLERTDSIFIWRFKAWKSNWNKNKSDKSRDFTYGFVMVDDESFKEDVFVAWKFLQNVKEWDVVWVQIIWWESKSPEWKIVKVLWKDTDKGIDIESFILWAWFKQDFSRSIKSELERISSKIDYRDLEKRTDLRNMLTFTIDWEDSKDLDDGISLIERKNGNFELYVHIADVTHYVREHSELDKWAFKRSTSVYLTDRVIPMLPEKLSNELCSLNPHTDKLTLTCEMLIWKDWKIKKQKVYESVISSDFRLTYKEVDEIVVDKLKAWNELMFWWTISEKLFETIKNSEVLRSYIEGNKNIQGVLNFEFPETKIELDADKNPIWIKQYPRYKSNKIIEEFMVSANEAVSREFSDYPFLHRIHPSPKEEDIYKLQETLNLFWIDFKLKDFSTKEFSNLLDIIEKHPKKYVLENVILRTLSKAVYSHENEGHFWLWLNYYSHFTSPIRRYPDLQIHRIIKDKIHHKLDGERINHYESILENVANHTSTQERKAEKLEYKIRDYYIVKYYKPKVWEEFEATIVTMMPKWFFVQLDDTAEWFVDLSEKVWFFQREDIMMFEDRNTGKKYSLSDKIKVKLIEADEKLIRLNFELV